MTDDALPISDAILAHCQRRIAAYSDTILIADNGLWTVYDGSKKARPG